MSKNPNLPELGTLEDVSLRDAWAHEAQSFTPWLASNLSAIGKAIGIPLELSDIEVRVQEFAADIVARNPQDDSIVKISLDRVQRLGVRDGKGAVAHGKLQRQCFSRT